MRSCEVQESPTCERDHGLYFLMMGNFLLQDKWLVSRGVCICSVPSCDSLIILTGQVTVVLVPDPPNSQRL